MIVMHDVLAAIVAASRTATAWRQTQVPLVELERRAAARRPAGDVFAARLARRDAVNVIAECKRRSPAKGVLRREYDPASLAAGYAHAGAAAVSVLTEPTCFDGDLAHLEAARAACPAPLLRKDFIVDPYQVVEARASGADAVLLIVAALHQTDLEVLVRLAGDMGLAALVEVHDRDEAARAVDAGARLVGVNCRNLKTLAVEAGVFDAVRPRLDGAAVRVAESGLRSASDVRRLRQNGYDAFLIGEWFMRSDDPAGALARLIEEAA